MLAVVQPTGEGVLSRSSNLQKEARQLADQVEALGYRCQARDGHSFIVWSPGSVKILASFPAHPSHADWRVRAIAELKKAGIVLNGKRTEAKVEVTAERSERIVQRVRERTGDDAARKQFIEDAVRVLEEAKARGDTNGVEVFGATSSGKSTPVDIARESVRNLLGKGRITKAKAADRWELILDLLDAEQTTASTNGATPHEPEAVDPVAEPVAEEPVAEAAPEEDETPEPASGPRVSDLISRVDEANERASIAEQLMKEAEDEAAKAKEEAAKATATVEQLEARVEPLVRELGEYKTETRTLKRQLTTANRKAEKVGELESRTKELQTQLREQSKLREEEAASRREIEGQITALEEQTVALEEEVDKLAKRRQAGSPEAVREELQTTLIQLLGTTEYSEQPPLWLLTRLDRMAGLA